MGLSDFLSSSEPIFKYQIYISDLKHIKVVVEGEVEHAEEYGRFWAYYWAKIMFNLGFPTSPNGINAFKALFKLAGDGFKPTTKFLSENDKSYTYDTDLDISKIDNIYDGEYLKKGENKIIQTNFPSEINEKEVYLSGFAMLQYCLEKMIKKSNYKKELCAKFFENISMAMLGMYNEANSSQVGVGGLEGTTLVPENAFNIVVEHTDGIEF